MKKNNRAAEKFAWRVPTLDLNSEYLVVLNPHAWDANLNVEYELGWEWTSGATLNLGLLHRQWTGSFHPLEIETLPVPRAGGAIRKVNALEE